MVDLKLLRNLGRVEAFSKDQTVFTQNDAGKTMYIVLRGEFGVYVNSFTNFPIHVASVGPGSFFGEMSVIDGSRRSATVVPAKNSTAVVIDKDDLSSLLDKSPALSVSLLETLQRRVEDSSASLKQFGLEVPALPASLMSLHYIDVRSAPSILSMLAQHIRLMNDILCTSTLGPPSKSAPVSEPPDPSFIYVADMAEEAKLAARAARLAKAAQEQALSQAAASVQAKSSVQVAPIAPIVPTAQAANITPAPQAPKVPTTKAQTPVPQKVDEPITADMAASAETALPEKTNEQTPEANAVRLLPRGYMLYNLADMNDNSAMLQEKRLVCPCCGVQFEGYIPLFSNLKQAESKLDGRVIYKNFYMLWYTNIVCPRCFFTDAYHEFSTPQAPKTYGRQFGKFLSKEKFTGFAKTHRHTLDEAILSYYQSLNCFSTTTRNPLKFANAWIRLYWLYGEHGPHFLKLEAAQKARTYFSRYLEAKCNLLVPYDKMRVNAILGELSATIGDYRPALEYFRTNTIIGRNLANNDILMGSLQRYRDLRHMVE